MSRQPMAAVEEAVEEEEVELSTVVAVAPSCLTGDVRPGLHLTKQKNPNQAKEPNIISNDRYGYAVQDDEGNDFNQQEQSDGDQVRQKTYSV